MHACYFFIFQTPLLLLSPCFPCIPCRDLNSMNWLFLDVVASQDSPLIRGLQTYGPWLLSWLQPGYLVSCRHCASYSETNTFQAREIMTACPKLLLSMLSWTTCSQLSFKDLVQFIFSLKTFLNHDSAHQILVWVIWHSYSALILPFHISCMCHFLPQLVLKGKPLGVRNTYYLWLPLKYLILLGLQHAPMNWCLLLIKCAYTCSPYLLTPPLNTHNIHTHTGAVGDEKSWIFGDTLAKLMGKRCNNRKATWIFYLTVLWRLKSLKFES